MRALVVPLILAVVLAGCASPAPEPGDSPQGNASGQAPEDPVSASAAWSMTDTEGVTWTDEGLQGKPALLFFFATWCSTCRAKAPTLTTLHGEYGDDVQFLSLSFDPTERDADFERWKDTRNQPWPHGVDAGQNAARTYRVQVQSWVVVLDASGETVLNAYNPSESQIRSALDGLSA